MGKGFIRRERDEEGERDELRPGEREPNGKVVPGPVSDSKWFQE